MIPIETTMTQFDSLPGEETEFSIGDPRWVMRTQADLYSNRELAVTREYSTNAYDAGKQRALALGIEIPAIEVTLPSMMSPYFKVRDYGYGMSADVLREVYTKFGISTKRDSNEFNGLLGYGSKSAVAYTNTFTVTSIHNGIKSIAVITRKPDWSIVMKIVSEQRTDEPSGTEILVPVHNWQEFAHKANDFYKFWLPGTVKVNGVEPKQQVGDKITDGLYYSTQWNQSYIVMGNVPYRINNPDALFRNSNMRRINFVAYVDNGDVEFTPSREDLKYTDHTKATLQKVIDDFEKQIIATAQAEIDNAADHAEAFLAWKKWVDTLGRAMFNDLEFKGDKFVSDFKVNAMRYQPSASYNAAYRIREWGVESMPKTMVVTEFDINLSSAVKQKAKQFANLKGWPHNYILFTSSAAGDIDSVWIKKDHFVTWEDLKAALPKAPAKPRNYASGPKRIKGTFDFITRNGWQYEKPLPDDVELYYITVQAEKRHEVRQILMALNSDAYVVVLSANRIAKFTRENPEVKEFVAYAQSKVVKDGPSLLSDEAKKVRGIHWRTRDWVRHLDLTRVMDPDLHDIARLIKDEESLTKAYKDNQTLANLVGMRYNVSEHNEDESFSIYEKYPLLTDMNYYRVHDHVYIYVNAVHAAEMEKKND